MKKAPVCWYNISRQENQKAIDEYIIYFQEDEIMLVKINTKDANVTERSQKTMEKKLQNRFIRYFKDEPEDKTTLWVKVSEKKYITKVELTISYLGYLLRSETTDNKSAMAALDKAIDVLERQIVKCKTKLARGRHTTITEDVAEPAVEEEPDNYPIVRVKSYEMKPLTVQEAILNMNMLSHNFYMFKNRENGKICTVYRRNDGDYGLIEAEE